MAKRNFQFEKRQKDLAKKKKQEEKRQKKLLKKQDSGEDENPESDLESSGDEISATEDSEAVDSDQDSSIESQT